MRGALLNGKCVEVNHTTGELMERSSLLEGMECATVAFILLPMKMKPHQHETLKRFVERETAKSNASGKLQIVCAREYDERRRPTEEEERAEEEGIRQILLSLPKGSCAIPPAQSKRLKILTSCCNNLYKLCFFTANVGPDIEGRRRFVDFKFSVEEDYSGDEESRANFNSIEEIEDYSGDEESRADFNSIEGIEDYSGDEECRIQNFIRFITSRNLNICKESVEGQNKTRELVDALKSKRIDYLLTENGKNKVMVDDLQGKTIGIIICRFGSFERIKLQQIYKDLQQKDSNFIVIWIPSWYAECGHGSYASLIQCMPWATFPNPQLLEITTILNPRVAILDKEGQIANHDALPLLLGWGAMLYPFTRHTIPESFWMEYESCLEFLLQGMNIAGRKAMESKMTFLYGQSPGELHNMKKLEQLTIVDGNVEVLHVGRSVAKYEMDLDNVEVLHVGTRVVGDTYNLQNVRQVYEEGTQNMRWPSLSFWDMIMFWNRCRYLAASASDYDSVVESNIMMKTVAGLTGLVKQLYDKDVVLVDKEERTWLVLVDKNGAVTGGGYDVLQMICDSSDGISEGERMVKEELKKSLSRGECTPLVKTFFRDDIDNHPLHPQHRIRSWVTDGSTCSVCDVRFRRDMDKWDEVRAYRCWDCGWWMCGSCWKANATQQAQQLLPAQTEFTL